MNVTSFVRFPEVSARLKTLLPPSDCRKVPATLKVEPRTDHYTLVGTAFDYLLRFEVQRRAPHAYTEKWAAENAVEYIERYSSMIQVTPREMMPVGGDVYDLGVGAYRVVEDAKSAVAAYVRKKRPRSSERAELARHALRLARLDPLFRVGVLDLRFEEADAEDAEDLLAMLSIVPFETLIHDRMMLLNPTFGESSRLGVGRDADLITGNTLVDIKTVKRGVVTPGYFCQLLRYLILARNERCANQGFPAVNCLAVYFSRHGYLWTFDVKSMVRTKAFRKVEEWFLKEARRLRKEVLKKLRQHRRTPPRPAAKPVLMRRSDVNERNAAPNSKKQQAAYASHWARQARKAKVTRKRLSQAPDKDAVKALLLDAGIRRSTVEELVGPLTLEKCREMARVIPRGKRPDHPSPSQPLREGWVTLPERLRRAFRQARKDA